MQPFFQTEEMARFLGYNPTPAPQQSSQTPPQAVPHRGVSQSLQGGAGLNHGLHGTFSSPQATAALALHTGNLHPPHSFGQQPGTAPQAPPTSDFINTTSTAHLVSPAILTQGIPPAPPIAIVPHSLPQQTDAMALPQAPLNRQVPMSPFMADSEHSYISPPASEPATRSNWIQFSDTALPAGEVLKSLGT